MILVKKISLIILLIIFLQNSNAQILGNILSIKSSNPSDLNICFREKTVKVFFENPSPFTLKNISINVKMPPGVEYVLGSINGGNEQNIAVGNEPYFSIDSIQSSSFDTIIFNVFSTCSTLPFLNSGGVPYNIIRVDYTANGYNFYDQKTIAPYTIKSPNLSITQITNQIYSGSVGDSYQRCISIVNGGTGALKSFTLEDKHGPGIGVNSISIGNLTSSLGIETIFLSGVDFTTIGDGDSLFETGEIIVVCEDITLLNCYDNLSEFVASWGCRGNECQSSFETANAFFPSVVPSIVTSTTNSSTLCFTDDIKQTISITNNGPGLARNVSIRMYQNNSVMYTDVDVNSIFYFNSVGDTVYVTPSYVYDKNSNPIYSCSSNPKRGFIFSIDSIPNGETIIVEWTVRNCCKTSCGDKDYNGWYYEVSYKNVCGASYSEGVKLGRPHGYTRGSFIDNGNPLSLTDGDSGTFSYYVNDFQATRLDGSNNGFFKIVFKKSPCINYTGNLKFINSTGNYDWNPVSTYQTPDSIVAIFNAPIPISFNQGLLVFDYVIDCSNCSGGRSSISLDVFYTPDTICGCELHLTCTTFPPMSIYCPDEVNCNGFLIKKYTYQRLNFGNPDYNEDGIPDNNSMAHEDSVQKKQIIFGDTVISIISGIVLSDTSWKYLYGVSNIDNKNFLSLLSVDLEIIDTSGTTYNYLNIPFTINSISAIKEEYKFDFTVDSLSSFGGLPSSFKYKRGDSVTLTLKYFTENNSSGSIQNIPNTVRIYLSDIVNPVNDTNKFDCYEPLGNIVSINHYVVLSGGANYKIRTCQNLLLSMSYYFSVGPCCNNYAGGNFFRKEYRHFSALETMGLRIPSGYNILYSRIRERRTAGSGSSVLSPYKYISPSTTSNDSLTFRLDTVLYTTSGGPAYPSDDGFSGTLEVLLEPTCKVLSDSITPLPYWSSFQQNFNGIVLNPATNIYSTTVQFTKPDLKIQASNPSIVTPDNTVTWTLLVDNLSNVSYAPNIWFRKSNISGVNITSIYDVKNSIYLMPDSLGLFIGDDILTGENRQFKITATFTSCYMDSLRVDMGWSCKGFPTSLADIDCDPLSIKLEVTPLLGALETKVIQQSDTIDLCDTAFFMYEATSIQRGTVYELEFSTILPNGLTIIPGSSFLSLFDTLSFINVSDPVNVSGTKWKWSLYLNNQDLDTNGLKGILNPLINKCYLKFKAITTCGFASGNNFKSEFMGKSSCGLPTNIASVGTQPLYIKNSLPLNSSTINIRTTYLTPCLENTYVEISIINNGPDSTFLNDSITVQLPNNINYVLNSFVGIHNSPIATPLTSTNGFSNFYKWGGISRVATGDSIVFSFYINAIPSQVNCEVFPIRVFNESYGSSYCNVTNAFCGISVINEDTVKNVFIYKGYLNVLNASGYSVFLNDSSEIGYVSFDIFNSGEEIRNTINTYVNYYFDADNNGVYSASDILISTDTISDSIPSVATYSHSSSIVIPSGNSCNILVVVDTSDNPCTCVPSQALVNFPYITNLPDTLVCANNSFTIGIDSIKGYKYKWTPATYLSNPLISAPTFSYPFNPLIDTLTYILEVDRVNCMHYDTMQIIISGNPLSDAGLDQDLCDIFTTTFNGNTPQGTSIGEWVLINGPSIPLITDSSLYNTTVNNLIEGTYSFAWIVKNGSCFPVKDTVIIKVYNQPNSNAGPDQLMCNQYATILTGNMPVGTSSGKWDFISGPNVPVIVNDTLFNTGVNSLIQGTYLLSWTMSNGTCVSAIDSVIIEVFDLPTSNAGPNQELCDQYTFIMAGNNPPVGAVGLWSLVSGPNTPVYVDSSSYNTVINNLIEGTYAFEWSVTNGNCPPVLDTVTIILSYSPTSNAGPDQDLCDIFTTTFNGNIPQGTSKGEWVLLNGPSIPLITDSSLYNTTVNNLIEGTYSFAWIVINGSCDTAIDTVIIKVYNQPTSNAGPDQLMCNQYATTLAGNMPVGTSSGKWDFISGPNTPVITNDTLFNTGVNSLVQGTYLLTWTMSNGNCISAIDSLIIDVSDLPSSNAGPNQDLCNQYTSTMAGNNPPVGAAGLWNLISGPNTPIYTDSSSYNTTISNLIEGTYTFEWSVTNGNCPPVRDTVIINVYDSPVSNAGIDQDLCNQYTTLLAGNIPLGTATGQWNLINGPTMATIINPTQYNTGLSDLFEGVYTLEWIVSNGNCPPVRDTVLINVYDPPKSIVGNDQELCAFNSTQITANSNVGSAVGVWSVLNAPNIPNIVNVSSPATLVSDLIQGAYDLVWTVSNGTCPVAQDTLTINNHPNPVVSFNANLLSICETECIDFTSTSTVSNPDSIVSYYWTFGDGQSSIQPNPTMCFGYQGDYDVSLKVVTNNTCKDSLTRVNYFTVYPKPQAYFTINPSSDIASYQTIRVSDGSIYGDYYLYDFGNGETSTFKNPTIFYTDSGNYVIVQMIESMQGCKDTFQREIIVKQEVFVYVPNTFTPDADNINDFFTPSVLGIDEKNYLFMVFNRWGDLIFQTDRINVGWDGTFKEVMSKTDTYVWKLKCQSKSNGEKFNFIGHVNLLK